MQNEIYMVQADAQSRRFNLPEDLTGRSVETILTHVRDGKRVALDNTPVIVDAANGIVEHQFTQNDLGQWGTYYLEFRVTGGVDDPTTFPQDDPIDFHIRWSSRMIEEINQLRGIDADRIDFEDKLINTKEITADEIKVTGSSTDPDSVVTQEELDTFGNNLIADDTHSHTGRDIDPSRVLAAASMSRTEVPEGEQLVIPEGYSLTVVGPYDVNGELQVDGRIKVV